MNPFKYGGIVSGNDFADRKTELSELIKEVTSGQNMLLYSPIKYGKSSLAGAVLDQLQKNNFMTAFMDILLIR
jgi:AAA+ ATPase superfamily predicted ATPase